MGQSRPLIPQPSFFPAVLSVPLALASTQGLEPPTQERDYPFSFLLPFEAYGNTESFSCLLGRKSQGHWVPSSTTPLITLKGEVLCL